MPIAIVFMCVDDWPVEHNWPEALQPIQIFLVC